MTDITFVTACDPKYVSHLQTTLPNWIKYKKIDKYPFIVYVNGFEDPENDERLKFLNLLPSLKIIKWEMPEAQTQREKMLSSFVFGTARDVKTPYWMKIDADSYATNYKELIDEDMFNYVITGHKWAYTKPFHWIQDLDNWASGLSEFSNTEDLFDPSRVDGRRYGHERVASYIQLHDSSFVRFAAELAGSRLPVPSHDTYLWYVAKRLGLEIRRHNFKRYKGLSNKSKLESLKQKVKEVDCGNN